MKWITKGPCERAVDKSLTRVWETRDFLQVEETEAEARDRRSVFQGMLGICSGSLVRD